MIVKYDNAQELLDTGISFKEHYVNMSNMQCVLTDKYDPNKGAGSRANLSAMKVKFNGHELTPTGRFWLSFCSKVGVAPSIFNLYEYNEVFNRVIDKCKFSLSGDVRLIEHEQSNELLAITDPSKSVADYRSILKLIDSKGGNDIYYNDGVISSSHLLDTDLPVKIGREDFKQMIAVYTPIDGYGLPSIYLSLLREICSNGMVAMAKAFKTSVKIGRRNKNRQNGYDDDIEFALERMFDSYSNDEGFDALIERLDCARKAPLSVREFYQASNILSELGYRQLRDISEESKKWSDLAGDLNTKYGLANLREMTEKQMSLLETDITVYEAVNYITEVTTHRLSRDLIKDMLIAQKLNGWVGSIVSKTYDLEGIIIDNNVKNTFQPKYFN